MATGLNEDEILQILKIVDESKVEELCLEIGNLKLIIKRSSGPNSIQTINQADPHQVTVSPTPAAIPVKKATSASHKDSSIKASGANLEEEGLVPVKAPILGIFYRAPSPGARPFIEEGSLVAEHDIVCTIEVMKVFNSVSAGIRGEVVRVCVDNGATVEYGQTLFLIRPKGESEA